VADRKELLLIEIREDGARVVKRHIDSLGASGDKTANIMSKLKGVLAGLASAKVLRDTIMLGDAYANMLNRLRVVTSSNYELETAMDAVYKMSRETRTSLAANVDMYARVALNTEELGLSIQQVTKFATQLNHAIILSGVTAREAQWGMVQFSQALASNALRGDELRAVMEQLPVVTKVLEKHLGVTRGELKKVAFEGKITTKVMMDAFNEMGESLKERFLKRVPTVDQGITVLRSSLVRFVGVLDQTYQGTATLARGLLLVADNMDTFGRIASIAGIVLGTVFLKNLVQIVAQMKLFSLTLVTAHPIAAILLTAAAAVAVFADKINVANDSTTKLSDLFMAFVGNLKIVYKTMREAISGMIGGAELHTEYQITLESLLKDAARFIDAFLGLFVGAGQVVAKVFKDIPRYGKLAWNALLSGLERVKDTMVAFAMAFGQMFHSTMLNIKGGVIAMGAAIEQALAGNVKQARMFADQAALSFENAATHGFRKFADTFRQNLEDATSKDSLAGAKFQVTAAGETIGEAFMRGFDMSKIFAGGIADLFDRAKIEEAARKAREGVAKFVPDPIQIQLLKDMGGAADAAFDKMLKLQDLWKAVLEERPGTENISITFDEVKRKMTELRIEGMKTQTDVISGFKRGWLQLGLDISNFADMSQQTITNAFNSMEDALVSFVTKGKVDFKGLVDSILADLTRLVARQMFVKAIDLIPGGGGFFSSLMETASQSTGKRALGGPVSPGLSYVVGERGKPEIFTPAQPGQITPISQATPAAESEGGLTIINVSTMEAALAAMESAEGKRVIINEIRTFKGQS